MSEKLRQKYPRQPLMWQRLLDFLSIKRVEIKLIPGKGVGAVDMAEGDVAGIYVCSCVPRNDQGINSRYAMRFPEADPRNSEPLLYVTRFTPKISVSWYIDQKLSITLVTSPSKSECQ